MNPRNDHEMKTLYISDMDGTLLGPDSKISPRSAHIISGLSERGTLITVATARTPATVVPLMQFTATNVPAIVMTGAGLWDRRGARFCRATFLDNDEYRTVRGILAGHGLHPFVYTLGPGGNHLDVFHDAKRMTPSEEEFYGMRKHLTIKTFHNGVPVPSERVSRTMLMYCNGRPEHIYEVAEMIRRATTCTVSSYPDIFEAETAHLEVLAQGVSKAAAALELKKITGAGSLTVFGDNLNDLSMFEVADTAVAVGNALPQVRERADVVIDSNTSDAVARYIEQNIS